MHAATSLASAIANSAEASSTSSCVANSNPTAVMTDATVATHGTNSMSRRAASASVSTTYATSTTPVNPGASTWKRTVDSHSSGARIIADVIAYVTLAKRLAAYVRTAHTIHMHAYTMATSSTGNFGTAPDSAIARSKYAPAMPSTALPSTVITPAGVSTEGIPSFVFAGMGLSSGGISNSGAAGAGCSACTSTVPTTGSAALAVTAWPSSAAIRRSNSRTRSLSCSTTDAIPSTVSVTGHPAFAGTKRSPNRSLRSWLRTTTRDATAFSDSNHTAMFAPSKQG